MLDEGQICIILTEFPFVDDVRHHPVWPAESLVDESILVKDKSLRRVEDVALVELAQLTNGF